METRLWCGGLRNKPLFLWSEVQSRIQCHRDLCARGVQCTLRPAVTFWGLGGTHISSCHCALCHCPHTALGTELFQRGDGEGLATEQCRTQWLSFTHWPYSITSLNAFENFLLKISPKLHIFQPWRAHSNFMTSSLSNKPGWILLLKKALELNSHIVAQITSPLFFYFISQQGRNGV